MKQLVNIITTALVVFFIIWLVRTNDVSDESFLRELGKEARLIKEEFNKGYNKADGVVVKSGIDTVSRDSTKIK